MKKKLMNFSKAFIAATLLLGASFGAVAQGLPNQSWDQSITVHPTPRIEYSVSNGSTSHEILACVGEVFQFNVWKKHIDVEIRGVTYEFDFIGDADLTHHLMVWYTIQKTANADGSAIAPPQDVTISGMPLSPANISLLPDESSKLVIPVTLPGAGTYRIKMTKMASYGCEADFTSADNYVDILVKPLPTITYNSATEICSGDQVSISVDGALPMIFGYHMENGGSEYPPNSIGWTSPVSVTDEAGKTISITAGNAGVYHFVLDSLVDANKCRATIDATTEATVTVNALPVVTANPSLPNATVCQGATVTISLQHGNGDYLILSYNEASGNSLLDAGNYTSGSQIPNTVNSISIVTYNAGHWAFEDVSIVDNKGCAADIADEISLTVNPMPTVSFTDGEICEGGSLSVTFTGGLNVSEFTLLYGFYKENSDTPDLTDGTNIVPVPNPGGYGGLPAVFNNLTPGAVSNSVKTYTQNITTGDPGKFTFYLKSIFDGTCTNTNPAPYSWMNGWQ